MCVKFSSAYYFSCSYCNKKFTNVVFENGAKDIWLINRPIYAIYAGVTFLLDVMGVKIIWFILSLKLQRWFCAHE
jgi:hypothetical protein